MSKIFQIFDTFWVSVETIAVLFAYGVAYRLDDGPCLCMVNHDANHRTKQEQAAEGRG